MASKEFKLQLMLEERLLHCTWVYFVTPPLRPVMTSPRDPILELRSLADEFLDCSVVVSNVFGDCQVMRLRST